MNIELKCAFGEFKYGQIVEVGKGKDKISEDDAKVLLAEGHAIEYKQKVLAGNENLAKEIVTLKQEVEAKDAEIVTLKQEVEKLKATAKEAKTK